MDHVLSWMTFLPLLGAAVTLALPATNPTLVKRVALGFTLPTFALGVWLFAAFDRTVTTFQYVDRWPWIGSFDIEYFVGVDGISITMVLLTALLCPLCVLASFGIDKGVKGYFALFLMLETGMLGVSSPSTCSSPRLLEVMLLPMYFLIGIWGGPRRDTRRSVLPLHVRRQRAVADRDARLLLPGQPHSSPSPS
jgi:NADH-quinone oxidoreductase subunit M